MNKTTIFQLVIIVLLVVILGVIIVAGQSGADEDGATTTNDNLGKTTITIGIPPWAGETFRSHLLANTLEEVGYETEIQELDPGVMYTSLAEGDLDVTVGGWLPTTHQSFWDEVGDDLEIAGINVSQTWLGLAIPDYANEDIQSLEDLAGDTEFGQSVEHQIIGIDPGAGVMQNTETAMEEYGLDNWELSPSSDPAMTTAVREALANEEPIIATVWEPHSTFALEEGNLRKLDDPQNIYNDPEATSAFLEENAPQFADTDVASDVIATVVPEEFADEAPLAYQIFQNFSVSPDDDSDAILQITVEDRDAEEVADEWYQENQDTVQSWIPDNEE